jgi:glycerol-3-phosphate dehydrogenase (NAD(P)+)
MKITILGAGSMGTAMASLLSEKEVEICIWARREEIRKEIMKNRVNYEYFPYLKLKDNIVCETNIAQAIANADLLIFAIPSHALIKVLQLIRTTKVLEMTNSNIVSLSVIKGIIRPFGRMFASEEITHQLGGNVAVFAGPTFASEIIQKVPMIATLASKSVNIARTLKELIETDYLKILITDDIRGVELCSILKNVYSIALGIIDGLGLGDNIRGLIIHYAINEMRNLLPIFGGKMETLFTPAGIGDFIATAFSQKSRNRSLGLLMGLRIIKNRKHSPGILSEGLKAVSTIKRISNLKGISTPIIDFVYDVCFNAIPPFCAFKKLQNELFKE